MDDVKMIIDKVTASLKNVPGVGAVVLGGSRARETHSPNSDIDIGIYYGENPQLSIAKLEEAAQLLDDEHRENLIAPPGKWGEWVNGGGWLVIDGYHVDLILRDIERVKAVIRECQDGIITSHYQTGHPHAYINAMYMGELAVCRLLWDAAGEVAMLKTVAQAYPLKMKAAVIRFFIFEAGFSHMFAASNTHKDDVYYVMAHLVRSVSCLNQVLFALNEQYCLNEKKAVKMIEAFEIKPEGYKGKVDGIFAEAGENMIIACDRLMKLIYEVKSLI